MTGAPLQGRRVVVTRSADQADPFAETLRALGATPVLVPSIQSAPAPDPAALAAAARSLRGARWAVFTSPSGVRHSADALAEAWPDGLPAPVAAVGPGTAEAARERGLDAAFVPSEASGDALAAELPVASGDRVVLFRSDIARRAVAERLRQRGADALDAVAYRTVEGALPADVARALRQKPDAVTFTSPSAVRGFLAGLAGAGGAPGLGGVPLGGVPLVAIGPVTAQALRDAGLAPDAVGAPSTMTGLADALVRLLA